eukprot:CAMPEP_0168567846 /NCGR_PEP_ID=MMETSP0413-20121227/15243_1 /TAXON_ID=136452 /ORGANISM="Filamoeba nolandi, Strain NC-AS-23-1" /LENGTH=319 /DNA_ID=CAMNT_0008600105 /DNA_START=55 /DNA_END=1011 /DNA_ORIENTATION=+
MVAVEERSETASDAPMQVHYVNSEESAVASQPTKSARPVPVKVNNHYDSAFILEKTTAMRELGSNLAPRSLSQRIADQDEELEAIAQNISQLKMLACNISAEVETQQAMLDDLEAAPQPKQTVFSGVAHFFDDLGHTISNVFKSSSSSKNSNNSNANTNAAKPQPDIKKEQEPRSSIVEDSEKKKKAAEAQDDSLVYLSGKSEPKPAPRKLPSGSHIRLIDNIIFLQEFDGSWTLEPTLLNLIGVSLSTLESKFDSKLMSQQEFKSLLATILAATFITVKFPDLQGEWQVIVNKASRFIKKECANLKQDEVTLRAAVSA